jgi:outer membrane protein assembly factor BamB
MRKKGLAIGIILLFIGSIVTPMAIGNIIGLTQNFERYNLNGHHRSVVYADEKITQSNLIPDTIASAESVDAYDHTCNEQTVGEGSPVSDNGPMNSSWPMFGHDAKHTGRSPYSTAGNPLELKWAFRTATVIETSPVIDNNSIIYFSDWNYLYALYPNGTEKWRHQHSDIESSSPAIAADGTIYYGAGGLDHYFYAVYPNGTTKWVFRPDHTVYSAPTIGADGTIYFSSFDEHGRFYALNPDGTEKWHYDADFFCLRSPVISDQGIVYFASHVSLYAFYPNGTLIWRLPLGSPNFVFLGGPSIGADGTIYIACDTDYLYAIDPAGTIKWQSPLDSGDWAKSAPSIGSDGTIYIGFKHMFAFYQNGVRKWEFTPDGDATHYIDSLTNAISADGTIYFGTTQDYTDCYIFALSPNGNEKWRHWISDFEAFSSPAIASDGTVYIGSSLNDGGFLYAFGSLDPNAPVAPTINGPSTGKVGISYNYHFNSTSPLGNDIYYYVNWGDGTYTDWVGPHSSGKKINLNHTWSKKGTYHIQARAKDTDNLWGPWTILEVKMPTDVDAIYSLLLNFFEKFFERHPHAFPTLKQLFKI